jgi:aryl-alcohol dehydrogenase-like predicted oxidoreductase
MEEIGKRHQATVAQVAIAWMLANPIITSPIIGANTVTQLADTMGALAIKLAGEENAVLDEMSAWE